MKFYQDELLDMDFIRLGQFLSKLPDDIPAGPLFQAIASINLVEQKFSQTLAVQKEVAAQIKSVTSSTKWTTSIVDGNLILYSSTTVFGSNYTTLSTGSSLIVV